VEIVRVKKDLQLFHTFYSFVEAMSWEEARAHMLWMLREWVFSDWEAVFAGLDDGVVVGMVYLLKTDYYPLPEIFPWVTGIYVDDAYRGQRRSEALINAANGYAKTLGFNRTYIPSIHTGLYEKYGYVYQCDIVNYGGDIDRLYAKDI